jgi:hypothetical protein
MAPRSAAGTRVLAAAVAALAACASARTAAPKRSGPDLAPGWTRRSFDVRDRGRIVLGIPPGWKVSEAEQGEAEMPAIRLESPGATFSALLTPLWNPGEPGPADARAETAQLFAEIGRRKALAGSVERDIRLEELSGADVKGFWFTATDGDLAGREPGPDEWRHILQGAAALGPVILAFTLLDNGPGPHRAALLEIVRTARHEGGGEADAAAEIEPVPDARTVPLRVAVPGKSWAVLVDLPDFRIGVRKARPGRGALVVGIQPGTQIVASVALRAAAGAKDAAGCRDADMASLAHARPEIADLRVEQAQAVARATYTIDVGGDGPVAQANAHAFLHRDGLCANVHVSKAEAGPGDAALIEAILSSVRFGEDL